MMKIEQSIVSILAMTFGLNMISAGEEISFARPFFSTNPPCARNGTLTNGFGRVDSDHETDRAAFSRLCPMLLSSTNLFANPVDSKSGDCDPRTLSQRLVSFATEMKDHDPGIRRPVVLRGKSPSSSETHSPSTGRKETQYAEGARRNAFRRNLLLSFLNDNANEMDDSVLMEWYLAIEQIWIDPPRFPDGGRYRGLIRRQEDGIPSAEALLRWFADNENFCDEVRAAASNRIERIVPRMPDTAIPPPENPTNGVSSVAAPAAEPRKAL